MKARAKDFLRLIITLLVFCIGVPVFIFIGCVGIIYTFIKHLFYTQDYSSSKQLNPIFHAITLLTDGFANSSAGELFNDITSIKSKANIKYGNYWETISAISGLRKRIGKDNIVRKVVDFAFSPFETNHCEKAIKPEQKAYYLNQKQN